MRKGGNPDIKKTAFKKGDPRINRKGAPKRVIKLRLLMQELLGRSQGQSIADSPMAEIVKALIEETKNNRPGNQRVAAAKELLDRVYGRPKQVEEKAQTTIVWNETKTYKK
jgi:hypothetical protein